MTLYIDEFLYRGRAADDIEPPAWHLIMADKITDGFGVVQRHQRIFNMDQAAKAGYALPEIISTINASALASSDAAKATITALQNQLDAANTSITNYAAEIQTLKNLVIQVQNAAMAAQPGMWTKIKMLVGLS